MEVDNEDAQKICNLDCQIEFKSINHNWNNKNCKANFFEKA